MLVIGARPQIIKSAPIICEASKDSEMELQIVHTGQHYDYGMSKIFFDELDLPNPIVNLGVGPGPHAWQTGNMMVHLEKVIMDLKPDLVLVPGDTNSTLASALTAVKLQVPVAHVEAGARSYDMTMPEEVNRRLTDHCSVLLFAPTENCVNNLLKEGIPQEQIYLTGDTMYDVLTRSLPKVLKSRSLEKLNLKKDEYAVLTVHRPENVDNLEALRDIIKAILQLKELAIIFPVHPRTMERLQVTDLLKRAKEAEHIKLVDPIGYLEMLCLVKYARIVFTDSDGLQKEAFWLHTPCITFRQKTEWVETVQLGANTLVGNDTNTIIQKARGYLTTNNLKNMSNKLPNPFGDGCASTKIVKSLKEFVTGK